MGVLKAGETRERIIVVDPDMIEVLPPDPPDDVPEDGPRAVKLTEYLKVKILGMLESGADLRLAAQLSHVSLRSLQRLRAKDQEYRLLMDEARATADERVIKTLFEMATIDRNVTACIFWLKNRQPATWRDRHDVVVEEKRPERLDIRLDNGKALTSFEGVPAKGIN